MQLTFKYLIPGETRDDILLNTCQPPKDDKMADFLKAWKLLQKMRHR